jgi:hypothetical protein
MANHLIKTYEAPTGELQLITVVNYLTPKADELRFITCVEEHSGHNGIHLNESKCPLFIHLSVENAGKIFNPLLSDEGGDEIYHTPCEPSADFCDLLGKLKLLQLHYWVRVWYTTQKCVYPKMLWQNVIAPMLPLTRYRRGNIVSRIKIPKLLPTSFGQKPSLSIDKLLADPVFAQNSTYRQIVDKSKGQIKTQ